MNVIFVPITTAILGIAYWCSYQYTLVRKEMGLVVLSLLVQAHVLVLGVFEVQSTSRTPVTGLGLVPGPSLSNSFYLVH